MHGKSVPKVTAGGLLTASRRYRQLTAAASRSPTSTVRSAAPAGRAATSAATALVTRAGRVAVPEVIEQQSDGEYGGCRVGDARAGDVRRRTVHRLEHRRVRALRVDVAARGEADAAGDGGGDVGEDVAEEVVGHDHVEALRLRHDEHRGRVDVLVFGGDVGELGGDRA